MDFLKNKLIIFFFFLLSGCSSIPINTSNSCSIFDERYLWYKHTKKVEKKWGTPIYIQLAIIKMQSLLFVFILDETGTVARLSLEALALSPYA